MLLLIFVTLPVSGYSSTCVPPYLSYICVIDFGACALVLFKNRPRGPTQVPGTA